ncbi:hypothetical protein [uncultured Pseudoteredinibacter sp.]|uniref:hypothetical protein n=1 Tax=uncultured Pseudoteredinibacter sp. TaxID=1641701 RepID=UPI00261FDAF4|nr:hypothetical protein [uncultured Pseudoteredinibacter sp.]
MKTINFGFMIAVVLVSSFAIANDLSDFTIRGISPGSDSQESCTTLSTSFNDERSMKDKLGIPRKSPDWLLNVDRQIHPSSESNRTGCIGGYKLYDKKIGGALVRFDSIEVKSQNNMVYYIKNSQHLNVGPNISDCTDRRSKMISSLINKYGKPTIHREDEKRGATFEHLVWDYSSKPNLRQGNVKLEEYEAYIQCEMYSHGASFALMKTETKVHSGKAIADSRNLVKAQKSFETEL